MCLYNAVFLLRGNALPESARIIQEASREGETLTNFPSSLMLASILARLSCASFSNKMRDGFLISILHF